MEAVLDQNAWNAVLVGAGFITVNMPCDFTYKIAPTDIDIHTTTDAQIYGTDGQTLYIKNPYPVTKILSYAKANS